MFHFKQFSVDQSGCAMKINTDGVLLGALAGHGEPKTILDIGTGTGVIAMMLAQRFANAAIDAVEIDEVAALTALKNFEKSSFRDKLNIYPESFISFFETHPEKKYDLIVSNPPFYINSLEAAGSKMNLAKHTDGLFFKNLIRAIARHLSPVGLCWLVLPIPTVQLVKVLALQNDLNIQHIITIHSFAESVAHREIIALGLSETKTIQQKFVIYNAPKVYSQQYQDCLRDFFTIF
jgi:tRNA1Val (adenine37-N6)-methyltransferase